MNPLPPRTQRLSRCDLIHRHRHVDAYAALVLAGGYIEAGEIGRRVLRPGDVAIHAMFAAHQNRVFGNGAVVLNLPVAGLADAYGRIADPDAVARLARRAVPDAAALLQRMFEPMPSHCLDWADELNADLAADPALSLAAWARAHGLAPETLSRGFRSAYGVTPKRLRLELRARQALQSAVHGEEPLAQVAVAVGFSDQAQMTRAITAVTGRPPGAWRRSRSIGDKTGLKAAATVR